MAFTEFALWTEFRSRLRGRPNRPRWPLAGALGGTPLRPTVAFDLGSAHSRIAVAGSPSLIAIPSRIAVNLETDSIVAVGPEAQRMLDRAPPSIRIESPIHAGVIANPTAVEALIRELLHQAIEGRRLLRPDFVISVPATGTSVHRHALVAVAQDAGARNVTLIDEGIAAALGADLPILDPRGSLIVDVGAEKTEIAVVALGGIVVSATAAVGGSHFCDAISQYLRRERHLLIGRPSAEALKLEIGSATLMGDLRIANTKGHDPLRGLPAAVEVKSDELVGPIGEVLDGIVEAIHVVLEKTSPELSADIEEDGLHLSGGGSLLKGIAAFLEQAIGLRVQVVADPWTCVVRGCQRFAEDPRMQREVSRLE